MTSPERPDDGGTGFLRQRLLGLQRRWQSIAGSEYDAGAARLRPELPPADRPLVLHQMRRCLEEKGGEIRARARAAALGRAYLALNREGRRVFLLLLAREFDLRLDAIEAAAEGVRRAGTPEEKRDARRTLRNAARSPWTRILTGFNALPQGMKFLVDLRADLIALGRGDPELAILEEDLKLLLTSWFDIDFLELRRITWNTASGALLERFMEYEAVHPVESWEDLKNRLEQDRRYFAYFHPRMPDEPLIFLEVALVKGVAESIPDLLDPGAPILDPTKADTAVFYSISNAQKGLAGVSFGGFLIKRVVDELSLELPRLKRFVTLSPLPRFVPWLREIPELEAELLPPGGRGGTGRARALADAADWVAALRAAEGADGVVMAPPPEGLREPLLSLAARYLVKERRDPGRALDPVAHFHLGNGARVERLNWMADPSPRGLAQSAGIMANYLYEARVVERNHERYRGEGKISASGAVRSLLRR